jgi:2-dehydro-3-deoxyphosphooctonate aldolase (KDO 8-P synthase)
MKIIAGPCAIESSEMAQITADYISLIADEFPEHEFVYKSSYDKANRTSIDSKRGIGMDEGLRILEDIGYNFDLRLTTDVHETDQVEAVAQVVDEIQIPALLSRQTDLIVTSAKTGKWINIKRSQSASGMDAATMIEKCHRVGNENVQMIERGSSVLNDLIIDWRNVIDMQLLKNCKVIVDVTHPHGPMYAPYYAKMANALDVDGLFMEVHPDPLKGHSDGTKMIDFKMFKDIVQSVTV